MPDPDPQPPKPRAVSPARWLLMLLPSVPILLSPWIGDALNTDHDPKHSDAIIGATIKVCLVWLCVSTALSFVLGLRLEKWRRGAIDYFPRAVFYALLILLTNCLIAFAGCAVGVAAFSK